MSHHPGSKNNVGVRPSSRDWHSEYKNSHLDSQHFDPYLFFGTGGATGGILKSSSPPSRPKLSPAAMSTFPAASFAPASYGLGIGLDNDAVLGGGGSSDRAVGTSTSMVATSSLTGPDGFSFDLSPGMGAGGAIHVTANANPLGSRFGAPTPSKMMSMSLGLGGLGFGFGFGPGRLGDSNSNGNGFANGNEFDPTSGVGFGLDTSIHATNFGAPSPYSYPPMPALGSGPILNPSPMDSRFDPSEATLQLPPVEEKIISPSDFISQYPFQDVVGMDDPPASVAAAAAAAAAAAFGGEGEELTPKKSSASSMRSKSTGGRRAHSKSTVKKAKKKLAASRPRRKSASAPISLKDAKSELGTNDGEFLAVVCFSSLFYWVVFLVPVLTFIFANSIRLFYDGFYCL